MQGKLNKLITLAEDVDGALELVVDVTVNEKCSIQVNYGVGSLGNLSLSGSNDNVNYSELADSIQAMNVLGASHLWDVDGIFFKWLKINLPVGSLAATVIFGGNTPDRRA